MNEENTFTSGSLWLSTPCLYLFYAMQRILGMHSFEGSFLRTGTAIAPLASRLRIEVEDGGLTEVASLGTKPMVWCVPLAEHVNITNKCPQDQRVIEKGKANRRHSGREASLQQ